eukprot:tig00020703_g13111.t1
MAVPEKEDKSQTKDVKKPEKKPEELSEEDLQKKAEIELLVQRIQDADRNVANLALETVAKEIKSATSSMTSVPRPLKFLRPHYETLKTFYAASAPSDTRKRLADLLSMLAVTLPQDGIRDALNFKLEGSTANVGEWGHEYVRGLAGQVAGEFSARVEAKKSTEDLVRLIDEIVPFHVQHNAEPEACDLLLEVEMLDKILDHVDDNNFGRITLYLMSCASYAAEPEDANMYKICYSIFSKLRKYPDALHTAVRLGDMNLVKETFESCQDRDVKKQLAYLLGRKGLRIECGDDSFTEIMNNSSLSASYLALARDLDVVEAKTPEDIYKTHLTETRQNVSTNVDSARQNLASTFVNAFVNVGYGQDKLMTQDGTKWLYKNKEHGMMSAAASLGMILMWDVDGGLTQIDKYLYSNEDYVKAGALLAVGIVSTGVRNDCDPALALLTEHVESDKPSIRFGAILGLGLAYAGTSRQEVLELLTPVLADAKNSIETVAIAALALGMVFVGTAHSDVTETILQALMEREEAQFDDAMARLVPVGLALLFLGKGESAEVTLEACKALNPKIAQYCAITVESCAYAGTGNVLKVQKFLSICGEHPEEAGMHMAASVLGIAFVAMAEELGSEMAMRSLEHLLQYGEQTVRRAVPLALGLLSISNPRIQTMDTLSKLSHDLDTDVAQGAILGLGLIVLHSCLDFKNIILGSRHYLLYLISAAVYPRMLVTVDTDLKPLPVQVRVGQAVDTVGDRAELATDEYIPLSTMLEGFVILKKNPDFVK